MIEEVFILGFIGYEEDYNKVKEEKSKEQISAIGNGKLISSDDIEPISDEKLLILNQTRCRHDPYTVYMQSDVSFYDQFYLSSDNDIGIPKDIVDDAKSIRRIYKDRFRYLDALIARERYMEAIIEKYGGDELYDIYASAGLVKEWVPPFPIYSRSAPDYELFQTIGFSVEIGDWDDDLIMDITEEFAGDVDIENMAVVGGVLVDPRKRRYVTLSNELRRSPIRQLPHNKSLGSVDASDLQGLQQMFTSWFKNDDEPSESVNQPSVEYYSDTPKKIRERYYSKSAIDLRGVLSEAMKNGGVPEVDDWDPNRMVVDSVTNRPMSSKELRMREFIRLAGVSGWNEYRLMQYLGVGSSYELKLMERKRKGRKKAAKKAKSIMTDIVGDDPVSISNITELDALLFDD